MITVGRPPLTVPGLEGGQLAQALADPDVVVGELAPGPFTEVDAARRGWGVRTPRAAADAREGP